MLTNMLEKEGKRDEVEETEEEEEDGLHQVEDRRLSGHRVPKWERPQRKNSVRNFGIF